jgi:hypothetical protein
MVGNDLGILHVDARAGFGNIGNYATMPLLGGQRYPSGVPQGLSTCLALFPDHIASMPPDRAGALRFIIR